MADYVDRIILRVGGVDLDDVIVEFTESRKRKTSAVNTMSKTRTAKGFKRGNLMYSGTMKVEEIDDPRVPDWDALQESGAQIEVIKIPSVGKTITFGGFVVGEDISDTYTDGDSNRTISWQALRRKRG